LLLYFAPVLKNNRSLYLLLLALLSLSALSSCKRDTWYNRIYHNITAHYNGYFNGLTLFNETTKDIRKNHKDDFNQVIPVFVYGDAAARSTHNGTFEQIIKKCSAVIQNHELSKWIDDSFLLIGKAYFMKGEYFEAIESFQYVYTRYKDTELAPEALVWLARAYAESQQYAKAQGALDLITANKKFPSGYQATVHALQADLYLKQKRNDQAIAPLKQALKFEKSKSTRTRYHFILGQLTQEKGRKETYGYYKAVLDGKPYYEMEFQARIRLARLWDGTGSLRTARNQLKKLLRDEKNKDYRDEIYYEMALLEFKAKNETEGVNLMKLSSAASTKNTTQKGRTYLYLAEYYFNKANYAESQLYYDSTASVIDNKHPKYNEINGKKLYLGELVENLEVIRLQDSLLSLAALPARQLDKVIDKAIKEEERKADEARFEKESGKNRPINNTSQQPLPGGGLTPPGGSQQWYFYNQQVVSQGYSAFRQQWGNRELADNWRRSKKEQFVQTGEQNNTQQGSLVDVDPKDPRAKYKAKIPFSEAAQAQANGKIQEALFKLGAIYRDRLSDYTTAIAQYNALLKRYPACPQEPEALYRLALLYDLTGQPDKAEAARQLLLKNYSDNQFAQLLKNPQGNAKKDSAVVDSSESSYVILYQQFKAGQYQTFVREGQRFKLSYPASSFIPQVDYLTALANGKLMDTTAMKTSLSALVQKYPGSEIAKLAQYTLDLSDPTKRQQTLEAGSAKSLFVKDKDNAHYVLIAAEMGWYNQNREFEIKLANFNDINFKGGKLRVQTMLYGKTYQFLVVREFPNSRKAMEYYQLMKNNTDMQKSTPADKVMLLVCNKENFNTLFDKKLLPDYKEYFQTEYLNGQK